MIEIVFVAVIFAAAFCVPFIVLGRPFRPDVDQLGRPWMPRKSALRDILDRD